MRRFFLSFWLLLSAIIVNGQTFSTDPVFPVVDQPLTLTVDASGTSLEGYTGDVWIWTWIAEGCSSNCDAPTNVNPATSAQDAAKVTRSTSDPDIYTFTFTPTTFFNKPAAEIIRLGFKLKSVDWADGIQTDIDLLFDVSQGTELNVMFIEPAERYVFVNPGDNIVITAASSIDANLSLTVNGLEVSTRTGTELNYTHTANEMGSNEVVITATAGTTVSDSFYFITREPASIAPVPPGIVRGINYNQADGSTVTLCLEAPGKSSAYVIGEFNQWIPQSAYQMQRDGDLFWIELTGLTQGQEYAFQYLVDENIVVADPFADKILDPNEDQFITADTYPGLKPYPQGAEGFVSVLQSGQVPYQWQNANFVAPPQEELVIYELLVRDFDSKHSYSGIKDHLNYLQELGVNAIELMPVMEFSGNLSWGYNPSFFFAPDKYYGSKNDLKAFIDECHGRGIAVILDMVLNHTHESNPLAQLYWDQNSFRPAPDNPWLNQEARHPFNVFYDFNHESLYTQSFVDTVNYYWLEEYKFDGYRFDLTKGFTQDFLENSSISAWNAYNQTRIDLLKRMTDEIRQHHPDSYIIFEHLADNDEEKVLADYGIMLWGNMNHSFNQLSMGYQENSSINWAYYGTRNWNDPNLIAYMESHDEERLMYRNLAFGNQSGGYSVKEPSTALERIKGISAVYYSIPGPKMIWQFGELGYDQTIDLNGRTGEKPIPWSGSGSGLNYDMDMDRLVVKRVTDELVKLKSSHDVFNSTDFVLDESQSLVKKIIIKNQPYLENPVLADDMNLVTLANFNVIEKDIQINFPHTGVWFDYFTNTEMEITDVNQTLNFGPGEFRIYTDVKLAALAPELSDYVQPIAPTQLTLDLLANEGVVLNWLDNSTIEVAYEVWRKTEGGTYELIDVLPVNTTQFVDDTALPNVNYTYYVLATNKHYQTASNEVSISTTDIITAIEGDIDNSVLVSPNPVEGVLSVQTNQESYKLTLYSLSGQKLIEADALNGQFELDMNTFKEGLYILKLTNDNKTITKKIIKQ